MVRVESPWPVDFVLDGIADFAFSLWAALYISNHESFVPNHVGPLSQADFFYKWQCTKKLGFKNIFNEEYKLY
jgi:hypothetical protein